MPSVATITSFYTFVSDTKSRAAQLNENFSNFRGHRMPINTDTVTSSDMTHDMGSADHYWLNYYGKNINLGVSSTASSDFGSTTTGFVFNQSGVNVFTANTAGFSCPNATTMDLTTTAATHGVAASSALNEIMTVTAAITNSTGTVTTLGRPVHLRLAAIDSTGGVAAIDIYNLVTVTGESFYTDCRLEFMRDGVTLTVLPFYWDQFSPTNTTAAPSWSMTPGAMKYIDFVAAGTYKYSARVYRYANAMHYITVSNLRLYARES